MIKAWQQYNKQLAVSNKLTAHTHIDQQTGLPRNTFFRHNDFLEVEIATAIRLDSPYIICGPIAGRPTGKEEVRRRLCKARMFFMGHCDETNDTRELIQDLTFKLMLEFISKYEYDYRHTGSCGPFFRFDPTKAFWSEYGPSAINDYGWQLDIEFELPAELMYDSAKWF